MPDMKLPSYFYGDEAMQFTYFRIPCQLITHPRFKHLSTGIRHASQPELRTRPTATARSTKTSAAVFSTSGRTRHTSSPNISGASTVLRSQPDSVRSTPISISKRPTRETVRGISVRRPLSPMLPIRVISCASTSHHGRQPPLWPKPTSPRNRSTASSGASATRISKHQTPIC